MPQTAELLFLETDGGCANCGLRDARALTIHHLEQTTPKNENYDNKLVLCHNCHQCHHQGKGPSEDDLQDIKRRLIIKTLTRPGLNALKQARRKGSVVAMPFLVNHLVEFGYLEHKQDVSSWSDDDVGPNDNVVEALYAITSEGQSLLDKWKLK
jgi:hypothetical protein